MLPLLVMRPPIRRRRRSPAPDVIAGTVRPHLSSCRHLARRLRPPPALPAAGHVDLVGAADGAETAAAVARGVDERDAAAGPVAGPQPGAGPAVHHVPEPGRRQRP